MIDIATQLCEEKYMRFPGGLSKAITFSYDDGVKADKKLIDIFTRYGLKGTFNLNSECFSGNYLNWHDRMDEREFIETFRGCGQEIAMHGARHLYLTKLPIQEAAREIINNRQYLEKTFGRIVSGMAYAYGAYDDDVLALLKSLGVEYARTIDSTGTFDVPKNWLTLNPTCHHNCPDLDDLLDVFLYDSPERHGKDRDSRLFYIWGHSYEFDDADNWYVIEDLAKEVADKTDVWRATNAEIRAYVRAYERLVFSADGERVYNPSARPVWLELRGETHEIAPGAETTFSN